MEPGRTRWGGNGKAGPGAGRDDLIKVLLPHSFACAPCWPVICPHNFSREFVTMSFLLWLALYGAISFISAAVGRHGALSAVGLQKTLLAVRLGTNDRVHQWSLGGGGFVPISIYSIAKSINISVVVLLLFFRKEFAALFSCLPNVALSSRIYGVARVARQN